MYEVLFTGLLICLQLHTKLFFFLTELVVGTHILLDESQQLLRH